MSDVCEYIHSRTQTSKKSAVRDFGIDIVRDLLKSGTGEPTNQNFGAAITGRDSVQFSYELDFRNFRFVTIYIKDIKNIDVTRMV